MKKAAVVSSALIAALGLAAAACGRAAARDGELLPGRTRPVLEHDWAHPRDLPIGANHFQPPDPKAAPMTTTARLRAYIVPAPGDRVVQIVAAAPLGRSLEQTNEAGTAELLSRLLSQQINERLGDAFVGRVQVEQDVDVTRVAVTTLADDWRQGLAALVGALRQPRLDAAAIGAFRTGPGYVRQTRGLGGAGFRPAVELARLMAEYPLAPPEPGLTVRREAVAGVAARSLRPDAIVIGIGGELAREDAGKELESLTSGWQAGTAVKAWTVAEDTSRRVTERVRTIDESGFTTWIAMGHPIPAIATPDEAAVAVMTDVLNIRLNIAVREIRGLANQAVLQMPATTRHGGMLHVRSGARPESIAPIILYSRQELSRIREASGVPTAEELEQVKGGLVLGKWQGSLDGARAASATYAVETVRHGSLDRLLAWPDAVRAVTPQQVQAAAAKYVHPEQVGTVLIGQIEKVRAARHPRWPAALDEVLAIGGR